MGQAASYAQALLALAETPAEAGRFGKALEGCAELYEASAALRDFLRDPTLPRAAQKDALARLAPEDTPQMVLNCLWLMVDKGRTGLLPQVAEAYRQHKAQLSNTLVINVCTPMPLSEEETGRICRFFARRFGSANAVVEPFIDPHLIGGIRVQVGDMLFDQSLFGRLKGLERAIAANQDKRQEVSAWPSGRKK